MHKLALITLVFFIQNCSDKTPSPNATPEDAKFDALASNAKSVIGDIADALDIKGEAFVCVRKCEAQITVTQSSDDTTIQTTQDESRSEQVVFEFSQNLDEDSYTLRKLTSKHWGEPNCPQKDPDQRLDVTFKPPLIYKKNTNQYEAENPQDTSSEFKIIPADDKFQPPTIKFLSSTLSVDGLTITITSTRLEEGVQETDTLECSVPN